MKKYTILWADDDQDDLMLMRDILQETTHNFEVVEVYNGKEALEYLQKAKETDSLPCLIILDINMPVLNGKETLVLLKDDAAFQSIPVIIFTTSSSEMDKLFCKKYGVEMITKPFEVSNFNKVVQKMLSFCSFSKEQAKNSTQS